MPRVRLETALWSPERGYRTSSGAQWTAPAEAGALVPYDLVILGDGTPFAGEAQTAALKDYVSGGGALLLLASERSPLLDAGARGGLDGILPLRAVGFPRLAFGEFTVLPSPDGGGILGRLSDPGSVFERLPPLPALALGFEPTSGALVPFIAETGEEAVPLIALQASGKGMCGVIVGVGFHRWRLAGPEGTEAYRILLSGLVEYLAGGHREPGLALLTDRSVYRTGERIRVDALAADGRVDAVVRGEIVSIPDAGAAAPITVLFRPDPERPGLYEAAVDPLPQGEYEIRGTMRPPSGAPLESSTRIAVEPVSVEMLQGSRDRAYLERIAASTGGAVIEHDRLAAIARLARLEADTVETRTVRSLRGSALLLAAIVAALAAEWLLRKFWGLV
jgi:hypothetical protein